MRTEMIPLSLIDTSDRIRPVNPDWAEVMAAGLGDGTELPAIVVRPAAPPEVAQGCRFALVIGGQRVEAHRLAGRTEIRADVEEMTRAEARIREVDENLIRHELTALDRAVMLLARKDAWEEAYPETAHGKAPKRRGASDEEKSQTLRLSGPGRFSSEAADKIGLSERTVQADIALAEQLAPDVIALLRRTSLVDNAAELRRLAAHAAVDQIGLAQELAAGNARTVAQARISRGLETPIVLDAQEQLFSKIVDLLSRSTARTQKRTLEHLANKLGFDVAARPVARGAAK